MSAFYYADINAIVTLFSFESIQVCLYKLITSSNEASLDFVTETRKEGMDFVYTCHFFNC